MSNSIIQLPYTGTTSGQLLDSEQVTVGANTVERERMQISGASASAIAPVTSSGGLIVTLSTVPQNVVSASSGLVQISGTPTIVSASSGLVQISGTPTIVSASSGLVQVYQTTSPWTILSASSGLIQTFVTGSSGAIAQVTSSGGMWVQVTNGSVGGGSTEVNIQGSTGTNWVISSAGIGEVQIASSGGINAQVTSSYGLSVNILPTPGATVGTIVSTVGAPLTKTLTTADILVYAVNVASTANAGNVVNLYPTTSGLSSVASTFMLFVNTIGSNAFSSPYGVRATGGLSAQVSLTANSTTANTSGALITVVYVTV